MIKYLNGKTQMMSAAMLTGFMIASSDAQADTSDLLSVTEQVGNQSESLPQLINGVFYVCGAATVGFGLFGVKNHVDAPSQNKLAPAVGKCAIGGALLATPVIGDQAFESLTGGASTVQDVTKQSTTIF